jgi:phosphatidylinositol phospholipase C delta
VKRRQYLDFDDFRRFVKLLKARPDIDRLYKKLKANNDGIFDFVVFEKFMRDEQQVCLISLTAKLYTNIAM